MSNGSEALTARAEDVGKEVAPWRGSIWRSRVNDLLIGASLPVVLLMIWQLVGDLGIVSTVFLPTPLKILGSLQQLLVTGELFRHLGVSLGRAALGFAWGGGLGLLVGLTVGLSRKAEELLDPSMQALRLVPHLAVAPLMILWFGFGELSKVLIIAQGAYFPMYIQTFQGIRGVDNKLSEVTRVLQFGRWQRIVRLIIPAAMPNVLLGLRLSIAISWLGLVVAELIGSQSGVGFLINYAKQNSMTETIFVGIVIFAVVGKLIDSFVRLLERRWLKWRDSYQG